MSANPPKKTRVKKGIVMVIEYKTDKKCVEISILMVQWMREL